MWMAMRALSGLLECVERRLDALPLAFGDQARKHFSEMRMLGARVNVLPSVGLEESGLDHPPLGIADGAAAFRRKVARVGFGLGLQNAIHRSHQLDEFVDSLVAFLRRELGVMTHPLELVQNCVLALLPPVIEEYVLEQLGELAVGLNAFAVVELG